MEKTIKDGRGEHGVIVEDLRPLVKGSVGGNDNGTPFIALTDDLKEEIGAQFVNGQVSKFVKDEQ